MPGDLIVTVGGRTGRDGIHGATFSSGAMTQDTVHTASSAVQIGNAIEQKRMFDALIKIRDKGYIRAITDCGAGGYASAVGEMSKDTGCLVHLEHVPLKYANLAPWEIWLSESQERMVLAIPKKFQAKALNMLHDYNVEAFVIGEFTDTHLLKIFYHHNLVCDLPMDFLHNGAPHFDLSGCYNIKKFKKPHFKQRSNYASILKKLLSSWDICSKESIVRQYDHEVQGTSIVKPFSGVCHDGPNDAAVIKPLFKDNKALAVAHGLNPVYNTIDPYWGAACAVDEAVRNLVCIGADPRTIALLDNFIWPSPDEETLGNLDRAVDGCCFTALSYHMPFVSGKDSLSSTYCSGSTIIQSPPTVCISAFAVINDCFKVITSDLKEPGNLLYVIGETKREMGGSAYFKLFHQNTADVPRLYPKNAMDSYIQMYEAIQDYLICSCHDCSEGGLAVALAEMCFGGNLGIRICLDDIPRPKNFDRPDYILFSESNARFIVEVRPNHQKAFEKCMKNVPFGFLGYVDNTKSFVISYRNIRLLNASIQSLKKSWQSTLKTYIV